MQKRRKGEKKADKKRETERWEREREREELNRCELYFYFLCGYKTSALSV